MDDQRQTVTFESGHSRARLASRFLIAGIVADGLCLVAGGTNVWLISKTVGGGQALEDAIAASDAAVAILALFQVVIYILTAIFFLRWVYRAYRNLLAFGIQGLLHSPALSVVWWFAPIAWFYKPFQVVAEIWRASSSVVNPSNPQAWKEAVYPSLFSLWWAFWLFMGFAGDISFQFDMSAKAPSELLSAGVVDLICNILGIVAALLCIKVIQAIDQAQAEKSKSLFGQPGGVFPNPGIPGDTPSGL